MRRRRCGQLMQGSGSCAGAVQPPLRLEYMALLLSAASVKAKLIEFFFENIHIEMAGFFAL